MQISKLATRAGEWLKGEGRDADIVVSSRIRLARNITDFPFMSKVSPGQRGELEQLLRGKILSIDVPRELLYLGLAELPGVDRLFLVERHLISREHASGEGERGVAFDEAESLSIMTNEEDHLRMQSIRSGFELEQTWQALDHVDTMLEKELNYAFHSRFGYLTACPTNVGTGMRVSVMLHLPALVSTRHLDKVVNAVAKINLVVRGLYGEGTEASGDFYQISNQVTLGKAETDIIDSVLNAIPRVITYERKARETLMAENRKQIEDRVWRAYGILKVARSISSEETLHLISQVRMGVHLGILKNVDLKTVNELFVLTLPAHLQKLAGREIEPEERNVERADFVRRKLAGSQDLQEEKPDV